MNIYLVEYVDLDFNEHQKYFLNEELANSYAKELVANIKDKIFNKTLESRAYKKDRYNIELRDIEKIYIEDSKSYPFIKFLEVVDNNTIKRQLLFNNPIIEYILFINITEKDDSGIYERIFEVKIKTIEVIEG